MISLSVIIPVYNTSEYLRECVESAGHHDNVEIILVDDGSDDAASSALCDEIARERSNVRVIHSEKRGLGGARELGLAHAEGEYVLFLDSDDLLTEDAIPSVISAAEEHGRPDVIEFGFIIRGESGTDTLHRESICRADGTYTVRERPERLLSLPSAWSRAWRREFLSGTAIAFPSRLRYEDLATVPALLAAAGSICSIGEALYVYRSRAGSIMTDTDPDKNRDIMTAFDLLISRFDALSLTDTYRSELSHLAVTHVLLAASVRVLSCGAGSESFALVRELIAYVRDRFPDFERKPYIRRLNARQRTLLYALSGGRLNQAHLLVRLHNAVS